MFIPTIFHFSMNGSSSGTFELNLAFSLTCSDAERRGACGKLRERVYRDVNWKSNFSFVANETLKCYKASRGKQGRGMKLIYFSVKILRG